MRSVVSVLALVLLGGCINGPVVIDGWEIGDPVNCGSEVACDEYVHTASKELDRAAPNHPPIVSIEVRYHARGGGRANLVVVLELRDGSTRAFGVAHVGIKPGLSILEPPLE
jgi:hypothetical protein